MRHWTIPLRGATGGSFSFATGGREGVAIEAVIIQAIVTVKERGIQNDGRGTNSIARAL
jgi:hypothetical protein